MKKINEVKTFDERKEELLVLGKKEGFITFEQLAEALKGLDIDSDALDELYNLFIENGITVVSGEENSGGRSGQAVSYLKQMGYTNTKNIGGISSYRGKVVK